MRFLLAYIKHLVEDFVFYYGLYLIMILYYALIIIKFDLDQRKEQFEMNC